MSENYELPLLKVNGIHVYYGAIHAIKGISLEVFCRDAGGRHRGQQDGL